MKKNKRVMVFGVFDHLHDGHRSFLKQARKHGSELIVVVARDSVAAVLKQKTPRESERKRMAALRRVPGVWKVVLGDRMQGTYEVIKKWKPDVICVGYDQKGLLKDIKRHIKESTAPLALRVLRAYHPTIFHSSLVDTLKEVLLWCSRK
ncbi:MAG: adenylyltransferase/cytidyltransferase family protein [Candidatus Sungbacteria bacterium]|nr:adenylyltransferase/cytidyltransferase family protein [Candidatus Sungbacteria bacterium]